MASKNWDYERKDNVVWLSFDKENATVNSFDTASMEELNVILNSIKTDNSIQGLIILSKKTSGFIAGADIESFKELKTEEEAYKLIKKGQEVFNLLESLTIPTIAVINGFCLGGGLELALSCKVRITIDSSKTKLGLPEVMLGIHPGWGGSIRLPKIIGIFQAMELMLTGKAVNAKQAFKLGLVDACIPQRNLQVAINHYLAHKVLPKNMFSNKIFNFEPLRVGLAKYLQFKLSGKINSKNYPAPYAILDNWQKYGLYQQEAMEQEAKSVAKLFMTDTSKNLLRVFFLQERLKGQAKTTEFNPNYIHVIGAGIMGGEIAAVCALKGFIVTLEDSSLEAMAKAMQRAMQLFTKVLKDPFLVKQATDRLIVDQRGWGQKRADIVIEAIIEKLEIKQELFKKLELVVKPECILATNTSTLPLEEISPVLLHPERLVGMHFFNPVSKMPLVEVITSKHTTPSIAQNIVSLAKKLDKLPILVKSSPGFLVNRILLPYLLEGVLLVEEGVSKELVDYAACQFGMPMGPLELADTIGLDVCLYAAESLSQRLPVGTIPETIKTMVQSGQLGKKSGKGFYKYQHDKLVKEGYVNTNTVPADISDRLMLRMIRECCLVLKEGIVEDKDIVDAGMIFGTGFPAHLGGPMHYMHNAGQTLLMDKLKQLANRYGERFSF